MPVQLYPALRLAMLHRAPHDRDRPRLVQLYPALRQAMLHRAAPAARAPQ
jgi:hypothetical protein